MTNAVLRIQEDFEYQDGGRVIMRVWVVPEPVPPSQHSFKYRLVYIVEGERIIGYDNERGKGDHRHCRGTELPYSFIDVPQLLADFIADVEHERNA